MPARLYTPRATLALCMVCALAFAAPARAQEEMPPSEVGVVTVTPEAADFATTHPGRVSPQEISEVRPRVPGMILARTFEQGSLVKQGDPLFRIDPTEAEVAVETAKASVARAEATLALSSQEEQRARELQNRNAASKASLDIATANLHQAEAGLNASRAELRAAEIKLGYTTVTAPISGRIGRALVTEGTLATEQTALATIQRMNPIYVDMQQPVTEHLELRAAIGGDVAEGAGKATLAHAGGRQYEYDGKLMFAESSVDSASGQVTLRAEFPNPDEQLLPGMYVRISILRGVQPDALLVPNQSIQRDSAGEAFVYVVTPDSIVEERPVQPGRIMGDRTVIDAGLNPGDIVMADGFQKVAPGAPVAQVPWEPVGHTAVDAANEG